MNVEDSYLRSVERRLRAIAPEHRSAVLDDLRGHFADAGDAGRPVDETIRGLGSAQEIADRAVEEFGADASASYGRAELAWRVLQGTAVATAIVLGVVAAFIMPTFATDRGDLTAFEMDGLWFALVPLLPTVAAALPLAAPRTARSVIVTVSIMLQMVLTMFLWLTFGGFFLPPILLTVAGMVVWHGLRGRGFGISWRIVGAVLTMLPLLAFLLVYGVPLPFGGTPRRYADYSAVDGGGPSLGLEGGGYVLAFGIIVIAVFMILGRRWAGWVLAGIGMFVMLPGLLSGALLTLMFIWVGGWWLTIGLAHAVATPRRR